MNRFLLPICTTLLFVWLTACATETKAELCMPSTSGIILAPTATRPTDPDLYVPSSADAASNGTSCLPENEAAVGEALADLIATEVVNLSLDIDHQELAATAVGDDMLAVAWLMGEEAVVALSRGGNHFQVRSVDQANNVSMVFSTVNRLHMAYEKDDRLYYRAADQGTHPADPTFLSTVEYGRNPQITLDGRNWAHIIYEDDGQIWHATHLYEFIWVTEPLGVGSQPTVLTLPPNNEELDFAVAYVAEGQVHIAVYGMTLLREPGWVRFSQFPLDKRPLGDVRLHSALDEADDRWFVASWIEEELAPEPEEPLFQQPIFTPAVAEFVQDGLNAASWSISDGAFDAGLWQTVPVTPGLTLTLSAWGLGFADPTDPAAVTLKLGIDPTGGTAPDGDAVLWTQTTATLNEFLPLSLTTTAVSDTATVFLRAVTSDARPTNGVVWDTAVLNDNLLLSGDFEAGFEPYLGNATLTVPEGWTPFYIDSSTLAPALRDQYRVRAVWSADGGQSWSEPITVAENQTLVAGTTGAFGSDVYPSINMQTEPASMSFVYVFAAGDPLPESNFIRYGRPYLTTCELATSNCSDPPGLPLLSRQVVRPVTNLSLTPDPLNFHRYFMVWDGLQTDLVSRDVYGTYLVWR